MRIYIVLFSVILLVSWYATPHLSVTSSFDVFGSLRLSQLSWSYSHWNRKCIQHAHLQQYVTAVQSGQSYHWRVAYIIRKSTQSSAVELVDETLATINTQIKNKEPAIAVLRCLDEEGHLCPTHFPDFWEFVGLAPIWTTWPTNQGTSSPAKL